MSATHRAPIDIERQRVSDLRRRLTNEQNLAQNVVLWVQQYH